MEQELRDEEIVRKHISWALTHVSCEVNEALNDIVPTKYMALERHLRDALQVLQDNAAPRRRSWSRNDEDIQAGSDL